MYLSSCTTMMSVTMKAAKRENVILTRNCLDLAQQNQMSPLLRNERLLYCVCINFGTQEQLLCKERAKPHNLFITHCLHVMNIHTKFHHFILKTKRVMIWT